MNLEQGLKIASARMLICTAEGHHPMSSSDMKAAIAKRYDKEHDDATLNQAFGQLFSYGWIDREYMLTNRGAIAYHKILTNKNAWAAKFFRKSSSPNVGPNAPKPEHRQQVVHAHPALPGLTKLIN